MFSKRLKVQLAFVGLLAVLMSGSAFAISEGGAIFLLIRPGARPSGMGSAFAAIADDATATYFNPAGLAFLMPEEVQYLKEEDVKDWAVLLSNLQEKDAFYLFTPKDLTDPASILLKSQKSHLLTLPDMSDWLAFENVLKDSTNNPAAFKLLGGWIDSSDIDGLRDTTMPKEARWKVLFKLNQHLAKESDLYRRSINDAVILPPSAETAIRTMKYSRTKKEFIPLDFMEPVELAGKLASSKDPFSKYIWEKVSSKGKAALKAGVAGDSAAAVMSREFNRLIKGTIYRAGRFPEIIMPDYMAGFKGAGLKGEELALFNMQLLEVAFPRNISLAFDSDSMKPANMVEMNRTILEAYLKGVLKPYGSGPVDDTLSSEINGKMKEPGWETLENFAGIATPSPDEMNALVDFLNVLVNNFENQGTAASGNLNAMKRKRESIEAYFPGAMMSYREKIKASPQMHVRSLLKPEFTAICDKYINSKSITLEDKISLLGGLNQILISRALYQAAYFDNNQLDQASLSYIQEGPDYLSIDDLTALNRRLLETAMPGALRQKVEPIPHYATMMHSPWLSDIWGDVGDMYYEFIAYAQPVKDWGVFGGNIVFLSEGENLQVDNNERVLSTFSSYEFSPTISYANKIYNNLAGGVNLKVIYSHLAPFGAPDQQGKGIAVTWALDLGLLYHGPFDGLSLGVNVQNIGPKLTYIDAQQADPLSRNVRFGTAYNIMNSKYSKLTAAWDFTKTIVDLTPDRPWREEIKDMVHHGGLEFWYLGPASLALRTGYVMDEVGQIKGATYGAGVGYRRIQFDFAMEPGGDLQSYNRKFSLSAVF
jgi:hypothetical protein